MTTGDPLVQQLVRLSREQARPRTGAWRRLFDTLTFVNMPIRRKFTLFSIGVSFWFLVIGGTGLAGARSIEAVTFIVGSVVLAHLLLLLFAISITQALTEPISSIIHTIRALTRGDMDSLERVVVGSGDEIGELSVRFNLLLETLHELNTFKRVIEEDDTVDEVYTRLGRVFEKHGLDRHQIYEVEPDGRGMTLRRSTAGDEAWCRREILVDCNLCRAKKTSSEVVSASYPHICPQFLLEDKEHLCLPFIIGGSTGGVVQFLFDREEGLTPAAMRGRVEIAERYLKEALPVLEAKRLTETLRESVMRDALTGLYNRRFLEDFHAKLEGLPERRGRAIGMLMCDLDRFKSINDRYGHSVGDTVLQEVAAIIDTSVRQGDIVVRYGGEEFLAVLLDVRPDEAAAVAERIREAVEQKTIRDGTIVIRGTISIGVAELPGDADDFWACVNAADSALYQAKEEGRNRVVRFSRPEPAAAPRRLAAG